MPIIGTYYEDMDLKPHTIYYYKVARLNSAMIEQEQSQPIKSGTTFYSELFTPCRLNGIWSYYGCETTTFDVNYLSPDIKPMVQNIYLLSIQRVRD